MLSPALVTTLNHGSYWQKEDQVENSGSHELSGWVHET